MDQGSGRGARAGEPPGPGRPPPPEAAPGEAAPPPEAERDALATAGLFCSAVGIALAAATVGSLWFVSFPLVVAGAAFGRRGMRRAATGEVARGRGVALAAYLLGLAGIALHLAGLVAGALFFGVFEDLDVFFEQYFNFEVIGDNFGAVLAAFWVTIQLALIGAALALVWGLVLALLRMTPGRGAAPVRWLAIAYIDLFRGVPLLLVVLLISGSFPFLTFLPEFIRSPGFLGKESIFWYGILSLMLTYGAYYAEVYRAGIEAVPRGQTEAARSLGMSYGTSLRQVIVPQAVRKVIPPMLNDFIALMKDTSLIQVIGVVEAVRAGFEVQATEFNSSALTLAAVLFILVTIPLARLVDRQLARQQVRFQRA